MRPSGSFYVASMNVYDLMTIIFSVFIIKYAKDSTTINDVKHETFGNKLKNEFGSRYRQSNLVK